MKQKKDNFAPKNAIPTPTRKDMILGAIRYQFRKNWRAKGKLVAEMTGTSLCSLELGGRRGTACLWQMKQDGLVKYPKGAAETKDGKDTIYVIKPGVNFPWEFLDHPTPLNIPDETKDFFSQDALPLFQGMDED